MTKKAIVLVSGGMDSAVVAAQAAKDNDELAFLHLNYGQKTHQKEHDCFIKLSDFYNVSEENRKIIDMNFLNQIGGSSLTDQTIDVTDYEGDSDEIPSSYVPFRNTHIIALAVSWAEIIGAHKIYIGANEEDSPGYPDCRVEYYEAYNQLIKLGTKNGSIEVCTPVISLNKKEIVELAISLNVPLEYTWSCYKSSDLACGTCDSCSLRLKGFKQAGHKDPINYK